MKEKRQFRPNCHGALIDTLDYNIDNDIPGTYLPGIDAH